MGKARKEKDVKNIVHGIAKWTPKIWDEDQQIVSSHSGKLEMSKNVLTARKRGENVMSICISRFTSTGESKLNYHDPIKRQVLHTFEKNGKTKKSMSVSEDDKESFSNIFSTFDCEKHNLKYITNWPVTTKPWSIMAYYKHTASHYAF